MAAAEAAVAVLTAEVWRPRWRSVVVGSDDRSSGGGGGGWGGAWRVFAITRGKGGAIGRGTRGCGTIEGYSEKINRSSIRSADSNPNLLSRLNCAAPWNWRGSRAEVI